MIQSPKHLKFIRSLWCWRCGSDYRLEAAHIRYADAAFVKPITGMRIKPDDCYVLPLCASCHREGDDAQHHGNERQWWEKQEINPLIDALLLFAHSGNHEQARLLWGGRLTRYRS